MQIFNIYNLQTAIISLVLVCLYILVLIRVHNGSRFRFVTVVSALMLASNASCIVVELANEKVMSTYSPEKTTYPKSIFYWVVLQGVCAAIRDACFNVAHWEFAYKYLRISYEVPILLKGETPDEMPCFSWVYFLLHAFNILVAVLSGTSFILYNFAVFEVRDISSAQIIMADVFHMSIGLAQLISGLVLLYALIVIARELRKSQTGDEINQAMMLVHATAFTMYNAVIIVQQAYYLRFLLTNNNTVNTKTLNQMYIAWIVCEGFNFLS